MGVKLAFEDGTVFVVGAGASAEFGLPVGWGLLQAIRKNSKFVFDGATYPQNGPRKVFDAVYGKYSHSHELVSKAFYAFGDIHEGVETAGSIDEYINRYNDESLIAELGKLQIAFAILGAENGSNLMIREGEKTVDWTRSQETWMPTFTQALLEGVKASEVEDIGKNITIICFNYDRCIEHYLEHALARAYRDLDQNDARKIVKNMNIIHPYGTLGTLNALPFGKPVRDVDLYRVASNIVTWSESVREQENVDSMKNAIGEARNIVFLGFAFANQNMQLLTAPVREARHYFTNVYATGVSLSDDVEVKLKRKISGLFTREKYKYENSGHIRIKYGMKCNEFMRTQLLNLVV